MCVHSPPIALRKAAKTYLDPCASDPQVDLAVDVSKIALEGPGQSKLVKVEVAGIGEQGGFAVGLRLVHRQDAKAVEGMMNRAPTLHEALQRVREKVGVTSRAY